MAEKERVKLAFWITGIVSGLLLILYLPVLIWSPPWGINGFYYTHPDETMLSHFDNGLYTIGIHEPYPLPFLFDYKNGQWESEDGIILITDGLGISIKESNTNTQAKHTKVNNPFTVWHIKWLEWTEN